MSTNSQPRIENSVFASSWLNPQMRNLRIERANCMFIEEKPHIGGLMHFKPLFKSQLNFFYLSKQQQFEKHLVCSWLEYQIGAAVLKSSHLLKKLFLYFSSTEQICYYFFHQTTLDPISL